LAFLLAIESSCDETAAAVVADGDRICSSVISSQFSVHGKYGGVVPELASREHLRAIGPVVREALDRAGIAMPEVGAFAVTEGPGLVGSLLVGITYAKALAFVHRKPLIAVNHIEGHVHAVAMEHHGAFEFPALALVASGGHTHLFEVTTGWTYRLLGRTRDDAAGEAFDKVAKLLGFGYPGGPVIDQLAPFGNPRAVRFTTPNMKGHALDYSFSGIKTAVLRWTQARDLTAELEARRQLLASTPTPGLQQWLDVTPRETLDLLASFQHAVVEDLLHRAGEAAAECGARSLLISGGVSANQGLRQAAGGGRFPFPVLFPHKSLSTDNAVMIAAAAFPKWQRGELADFSLKAKASLLPRTS
jgi:N6-L-threonylcarbamoyladenine synthase